MKSFLTRRLSVIRMLLTVLAVMVFSHDAPSLAADSKVDFRILLERNAIAAREEIWIGVEQNIAPGWHTYWLNPGDSGAKPNIRWTLPPGFRMGDIHWPVPHKLPFGPLLNYGYEDRAVLLQKLSVPDPLPPGPLAFSADIDILVCKEECIPEFAKIEFTLNQPGGLSARPDAIEQALAALPETAETLKAGLYTEDGDFMLRLEGTAAGDLDLQTLEFLPLDWGIVANAAPVTAMRDGEAVILRQQAGERVAESFESIGGVIAYEDGGARKGITIEAALYKQAQNAAAAAAPTGSSFLLALLLALAGGVILNLMPCVFPVLSIKALSLVKIAAKDSSLARLHGISYTAGVVLSFLVIAAALIGLKSAGAEIGWGFQLQNPLIVGALAYLLFVIGLSLSGLFEFGGGLVNFGGGLTKGQGGPAGSFFTGILATIVATPCTAPFMGVAIGYALLQPALLSLLVFAALGLGLALPYLLLSFLPQLQHILPKPGPWMETFRQFLAFPMFASAAWLVWVLAQQAGPMSVLAILLGMTALAFGIWALRHLPASGAARLAVMALAALSFLCAALLIPANTVRDAAPLEAGLADKVEQTDSVFGEIFSQARLDNILENEPGPVFVEMTAAWCITCKFNHATSLNIASTRELFAEQGVRYLIGDWTNQDAEITKYLTAYGRSGVPIYVFYGEKNAADGQRPEPIVLPQILTPGLVAAAVKGS